MYMLLYYLYNGVPPNKPAHNLDEDEHHGHRCLVIRTMANRERCQIFPLVERVMGKPER